MNQLYKGITPEMLFRFADRKRTKNVKKAVFKQTLISLGISKNLFYDRINSALAIASVISIR